MKQFLSVIILLFFTTSSFISYSQTADNQTTDSLQITTPNGEMGNGQTEAVSDKIDDDISPALAVIALFGIGLMFASIGVGIVLAILALLVLFGLIGAGILSTSVLVGIYNKSFEKGFKTFLILVTTIGGLIIGGVGVWLLNKMVHWFTTENALLIGAVGGLVAGFLFGMIVFYVIRKLAALLKEKLHRTEKLRE